MWQCKKSLAVAIAVVAALLPPGVSRAQECNETAPNMLLVVDLSGSMDDYVSGWSGPTKWDVVKGAVKSIADKYALNSIRFGLELFADPDQSGNCTAGKIHVGIADNNAAAIQNKMNAESPWSNTPIKGALDTANAYQGIRDATRSNYVLLFTDGQETCDADQRAPVQAVKNLRANNIKTFVVGFGSGVDSALLAEMAAEGGTARPVPPHYYAADTSVELSDAFEEIASIISAIGGPCSVPGLLGVCAQSEWSCSNGNVVCLQENWPSVETCDGLDNNCDGPIDEDLIRLCPADGGTGVQVCSSGTWGECVVDYDGAIPDSGPMDAGSPDTGTPDAGAPDTGTPDTETPDRRLRIIKFTFHEFLACGLTV
ncbi:MAG: VWA domain-containing protein [Deltaproteobacteria bacterium]|nr:VWA domain-containing protein [Deltaproteobacteria bacterium]